MVKFLRRAWYAIRQRRLDAELAEEMEFHRALKQRELERTGITSKDAEYASRRALGNATLAREDARAVWVWRWLDDLRGDLVYSMRSLRKSPGFAAAAVLTLALVIGANAAIFSAVHTVLLKPLSVHEPDNLVVCWGSDPSHNLTVVELSYRTFERWATNSRSFSHTAAMGSSTWPAVLERNGESVRLSSAGVSVSFFDTLGVVPEVGRGFRPEDDVPNAPRVVVLSHGTWVRRFGAGAEAIGTAIRLDDEPHTIVGVMREGFDFPRGADFWTPVVPILAASTEKWRADALENAGVLFVIGRLRGGVTPRMATDELERLDGELAQASAVPRLDGAVVVTPFLTYVFGPVRPALWALLAAVGVLLLIGSANVSGLMLTRVSLRRREHAVRLALGATSRIVARHWMVETLVLSLAGGVLGLVTSYWMVKAIVVLAPDDLPRLADISISLPVALFTFGVVLATALLCGAAPIRYAGASNLLAGLNDAGRSTPGKQTYRTRSLLLILQIGLSVALLVAAGLVVRSFVNLRNIDLGFSPANVVVMNVQPRSPTPAANQWIDELLDRVRTLPDVQAAGAVYLRPLALGPIGQETSVILEGQPDTPQAARENPALNYQVATPGYFVALGIQLRQGRLLNDQDTSRSPRVALVGETTARRLWPGQNAVGKRMLMPTFTPEGPPSAWRTVVGVVGDVRYRGLDDVRLDVYDAALQSPLAATDLAIRTSGDFRRIAGAIQAEARRLDPRVVVDRLTTMDAVVLRAVAPWRFSVWMFTVFAVMAFVLTTVGLFSLVSLDVAQRRHEFAVRLALGANRSDIVRPVLLSAARRGLAGVALGVLAATAATRGIRSLLIGVEPLDIATFAAVMALVLGVVALASWLPAQRATRVDPMVALRCE